MPTGADRGRAIEQAIERAYDAATNADGWSGAIRVLASAMGGFDAQVLVVAQTGAQFLGEPLLAEQDDYVEYWHEQDVRRLLAARLPAGSVIACNFYFDEDFVKTSPIYQEFLIPYGWRYAAGAKLDVDDGEVYLAIHRNPKQGPYEPQDLNLLRQIAPHFERAVGIHRRFGELHGLTSALEASLDRLHGAAFVVHRDGKIAALNRAAEAIVRTGTYLTVKSGRLSPASGGAASELRRLLVAATTAPAKGGFVRLSAQPAPDTCALEIAPLPAPSPLCQSWQVPLALVLVVDARQRLIPVGRQLIDLFGLTSAEARLAVELAEGKRLKDIVHIRKVTEPTLRSQMRAIFAKTGTTRQAELISLLSRMPSATHFR